MEGDKGYAKLLVVQLGKHGGEGKPRARIQYSHEERDAHTAYSGGQLRFESKTTDLFTMQSHRGYFQHMGCIDAYLRELALS
jgi:hypothetical protein